MNTKINCLLAKVLFENSTTPHFISGKVIPVTPLPFNVFSQQSKEYKFESIVDANIILMLFNPLDLEFPLTKYPTKHMVLLQPGTTIYLDQQKTISTELKKETLVELVDGYFDINTMEMLLANNGTRWICPDNNIQRILPLNIFDSQKYTPLKQLCINKPEPKEGRYNSKYFAFCDIIEYAGDISTILYQLIDNRSLNKYDNDIFVMIFGKKKN